MPDRNGKTYSGTWVPGQGFTDGGLYPTDLSIAQRYAPLPAELRSYSTRVVSSPLGEGGWGSGFETGPMDEMVAEIINTASNPSGSTSQHGGQGSYESYGYFRYGFNGQEKSDEIKGSGNSYTAEFWEYDPRVGRRWNVDPVVKVYESPYAALGNNPIFLVDQFGADTTVAGAGGDHSVTLDEKQNSLEFYQSSENYLKSTGARSPAQAGQLRSFSNALGKFTANWTTGSDGVVSFAGYLNEKGKTFETALKDLVDFANSWKYKLFQLGEMIKKDYVSDPLGHTLNITFGLMTMSATAAVEPNLSSFGYNPSVTTQRNLSGLGTLRFASKATANGSFYSVAFETTISNTLYPLKGPYSHFKAANTALNTAITSDAIFANSMKQLGFLVPKTPSGIITGGKIPNFVWHHGGQPGVMQLVPQRHHTSGSVFWNTLHPGGRGGMSIWGGGYKR